MNYNLPLNFFPLHTSLSSFTLIHRGKKFPVNSLVIKLLSPKIANLIQNDIHTYEMPSIPGPIDDFILLIFGKTVELNPVNSKYINFWAEDLQIQFLIDETEEFLLSNNTCDTLIEFTTLLIESDMNYVKYIQIVADKIEQITTYYPFESFSPKLVGALCNCKNFDMNKYLLQIFKFINNEPEKNGWIIKCINFSEVPPQMLEMILSKYPINLNLIRPHLIGSALDFNQRKGEAQDNI